MQRLHLTLVGLAENVMAGVTRGSESRTESEVNILSCEKAEQLQDWPLIRLQEGSVAVHLISVTFDLNIPI